MICRRKQFLWLLLFLQEIFSSWFFFYSILVLWEDSGLVSPKQVRSHVRVALFILCCCHYMVELQTATVYFSLAYPSPKAVQIRDQKYQISIKFFHCKESVHAHILISLFDRTRRKTSSVASHLRMNKQKLFTFQFATYRIHFLQMLQLSIQFLFYSFGFYILFLNYFAIFFLYL